jgi:hypothetical protein
MALPDRVFVIVVVPQGGRQEDRMPLLSRPRRAGAAITPVFSSMRLATTFLDRAQALGHAVALDYIFPAAGGRLADDFPEYEAVIDVSPEAYFPNSPSS